MRILLSIIIFIIFATILGFAKEFGFGGLIPGLLIGYVFFWLLFKALGVRGRDKVVIPSTYVKVTRKGMPKNKETVQAKKYLYLLIPIVIVIIICTALFFYEIKYNTGGYDILISNRKNHSFEFGVQYKNKFELWKFKENQQGGIAERKVW